MHIFTLNTLVVHNTAFYVFLHCVPIAFGTRIVFIYHVQSSTLGNKSIFKSTVQPFDLTKAYSLENGWKVCNYLLYTGIKFYC